MSSLLELHRVSKSFRDGTDEVHALREVDLTVEVRVLDLHERLGAPGTVESDQPAPSDIRPSPHAYTRARQLPVRLGVHPP